MDAAVKDRVHLETKLEAITPLERGTGYRLALEAKDGRREDYSQETVIRNLERLGVFKAADVLDTLEVPIRCAYPIYDLDYEPQVASSEKFFAGHPRIFNVGRHAQFAHRDVDEIFEVAEVLTKDLLGKADQFDREAKEAARAGVR